MHDFVLNKNKILLLEDFSDYNRSPKFHLIINRLHVNERFSIKIDHRNNTTDQDPIFVRPDLGPNYLQRLSADIKSHL